MSNGKGLSARKQLVDATIESLHRHGLSDTTVATITEIAGLSRGMVRHCFASKSAMMVAAYERLLSEWSQEFFARRSDSHYENIIYMVESFFVPENFDTVYLSAWLAFLEASLHDEDIRRITLKEYSTWRIALREEINAYSKELNKPIDAERISNTILALSDGLWIRHALEPHRLSKPVARKLCIDFVKEMLGQFDTI